MDKKEFLEILKEQLTGQLPEATIAGHIQYYENYIEDAVKRGKNESAVLGELGDPRLIAKTLVDTAAEPEHFSDTSEYKTAGSEYGSADYGSEHRAHRKIRKLDLSTWWGKAIVILVAAGILALMFVALSVILPIFALGCVIIYLVSHFKKR